MKFKKFLYKKFGSRSVWLVGVDHKKIDELDFVGWCSKSLRVKFGHWDTYSIQVTAAFLAQTLSTPN